MSDTVILVDESDKEIGLSEKIEAHKQGALHRAVSVLIFNSDGEILLQKRAKQKYHSAGLWTNTTCTHPRPNETNLDAAKRRLFEEMGLNTDLKEFFSFRYKAFLDNNLTENEYDHVFFGISDSLPLINSSEAEDYEYVSFLDLITKIQQIPDNYTIWFKIIIKEGEKDILKYCNSIKKSKNRK